MNTRILYVLSVDEYHLFHTFNEEVFNNIVNMLDMKHYDILGIMYSTNEDYTKIHLRLKEVK